MQSRWELMVTEDELSGGRWQSETHVIGGGGKTQSLGSRMIAILDVSAYSYLKYFTYLVNIYCNAAF